MEIRDKEFLPWERRVPFMIQGPPLPTRSMSSPTPERRSEVRTKSDPKDESFERERAANKETSSARNDLIDARDNLQKLEAIRDMILEDGESAILLTVSSNEYRRERRNSQATVSVDSLFGGRSLEVIAAQIEASRKSVHDATAKLLETMDLEMRAVNDHSHLLIQADPESSSTSSK